MSTATKLKAWAGDNGFTLTGPSAVGIRDGFLVTLTAARDSRAITAVLSVDGAPEGFDGPDGSKRFKRVAGVKNAVYRDRQLTLSFVLFSMKKLSEKLDAALAQAREAGFVPAAHCELCARETSQTVYYSGAARPMCDSCARSKTEEDEEIRRRFTASGLFGGILGALLGGVLGAVPYILAAYFADTLYALLAIPVGFCAFWGYKLGKGPRHPVCANLVLYVCSFLSILAASVALELYVVYEGFAELWEVDMAEMVSALPVTDTLKYLLFQDGWGFDDPALVNELASGMWQAIGLSLLFGLLGVVFLFRTIRTYTVPKAPVSLRLGRAAGEDV